MNTSKTRKLPSPPSLITALRVGFDAITNNIVLILFPVALDSLLWLGPHLRLTQLINSVIQQLGSLYSLQDPGAKELLQSNQTLWAQLAEHFNLLSALRSYPVGIPSLMAYLSPAKTPAGFPGGWEIHSLGGVILTWILITLLGLMIGTIYFAAVSNAALSGQVNWRSTLTQWPWASLQVLLLSLLLAGLLIAVSIPGSFVISLSVLGGLTIGQCAIILYGLFLIWLIIPLLFSSHGIFVNRQNVFHSLKTSIFLTRRTIFPTLLFFLAVLLLSKGLDSLWMVPPETSWFMLIGIAGHAFVTTGLLAASFVYYRDAIQWLQTIAQELKTASQHNPIRGE